MRYVVYSMELGDVATRVAIEGYDPKPEWYDEMPSLPGEEPMLDPEDWWDQFDEDGGVSNYQDDYDPAFYDDYEG